jgi:amino acid transporter
MNDEIADEGQQHPDPLTFTREGETGLAEARRSELQGSSLNLTHTVFQSVTNMAPAAAIVYDFPLQAGVAAAGAALVLGNVVALIGIVLVAFTVTEFARKLPSAGGYFTYISRSIGPKAGTYTGWTFFLYSLVLPAEVTIIWAGITQGLVLQYIHIHVSWIVFEALILAVVALLSYTGVRRSARVAMIAGSIEILIFVALSVAWLVHPASPVNLKPFLPSSSPTGWAGVLGLGMVFGILNFVGFEGAAPLGEETADSKRNVPRAVMGSAIAIGVLYVFVSFATVFGWGFNHIASFATSAAPYNALASRVWGPAWLFVYLAITNSSFACSMAIGNQASRVLYAMGRVDLLPKSLSRTHPKYKTPYVAVVAQASMTFLIALVAGLIWGTINGFGVLATTLVIGAVIVYCLGAVGLPILYRREHPNEFSPIKHVVVPLLALALLVYVMYRTVWPVPAYPFNVPAYLSMVWIVIGFGFVALVTSRSKGRLGDAGALFSSED